MLTQARIRARGGDGRSMDDGVIGWEVVLERDGEGSAKGTG